LFYNTYYYYYHSFTALGIMNIQGRPQ